MEAQDPLLEGLRRLQIPQDRSRVGELRRAKVIAGGRKGGTKKLPSQLGENLSFLFQRA